MKKQKPTPFGRTQQWIRFRMFFARGLGIVLPTVLTIYLVLLAWSILDRHIAGPINIGVQTFVTWVSPYPAAGEEDYLRVANPEDLPEYMRQQYPQRLKTEVDTLRLEWQEEDLTAEQRTAREVEWARQYPETRQFARELAVRRWWHSVAIFGWPLFDLIGLVLAILLVYFIGLLLGNYIGRSLYARGERLIDRLPLVRNIYSSTKQVTDFFFGDPKQQMNFSRVVAVQYPRRGLWSVGLVTGETMYRIQQEAGHPCLTVFVPSSPTPFTGYVITVPKHDTIDLDITIEEAIKFTVSGGVLVPPSQRIEPGDFHYAGIDDRDRVPQDKQQHEQPEESASRSNANDD